LFIIWSKFQSGAEGSSSYSGPTKNVCSRGLILSRRKLVDPEDKLATLANMTMKNQEQAPELFVAGQRPGRGGGGKRENRERKPRGDRDGEDGEQGEKREKREKKTDKERDEESKGEAPAAPGPSASEKKMHLESLLNYVAFNRRPQQRVLLLEEGASPPSPPKRLRPGLQPDGTGEITGAAAEQANAEAQMVLSGAVAFKTATVSKDLYEHLMDKQVEITERTFTLMIEGCVLAGDLKAASDFLMKMETSGYCPESDLLDKVMDLYSQQKSQRQKQAEAPKEESTPMVVAPPAPEHGVPPEPAGGDAAEGDAEKQVVQTTVEDDMGKSSSLRSRLKLSSDAPVFVPSFMPAPPAPPVDGAPAGDEEDKGEVRTSLRTKLVASSKPFEPLFNVTFDPSMYTWTVDNTGEGGSGDGQGKGDKSGGKGEKNAWASEELKEGGKKGKTGDGKEGKEGKGKGKVGKESKSGGKAKKGTESGKSGSDQGDAAEKDAPAKHGAPRWKPKE